MKPSIRLPLLRLEVGCPVARAIAKLLLVPGESRHRCVRLHRWQQRPAAGRRRHLPRRSADATGPLPLCPRLLRDRLKLRAASRVTPIRVEVVGSRLGGCLVTEEGGVVRGKRRRG